LTSPKLLQEDFVQNVFLGGINIWRLLCQTCGNGVGMGVGMGQPELRDFFCTIMGAPRRNRCIQPEVACHITQRGVDRREVFSTWSSARAHQTNEDLSGILDMGWWKRERPRNWEAMLRGEDKQAEAVLRSCTYAGKPFGEEGFVREIGEKFGRYWDRGRPRKGKQSPPSDLPSEDSQKSQFSLF
jgi:hypothetical protein